MYRRTVRFYNHMSAFHMNDDAEIRAVWIIVVGNTFLATLFQFRLETAAQLMYGNGIWQHINVGCHGFITSIGVILVLEFKSAGSLGERTFIEQGVAIAQFLQLQARATVSTFCNKSICLF